MAANGLNSTRALWAVQYQSAPRKRIGAQEVTVPAADNLDITNLCPTKAQCGDAPYFDLVVTAALATLEAGLLGVGVSDAVGVDPAVPQYPYLAEEETDCIRVRGFFPLAAAGDVVLDTPMITVAGVAVPNRILLINGNAQTEADVQIIFEIPDLNWV